MGQNNLAKGDIAGMNENPRLVEGEVVGGQRWYHSKERWWFPIGLGSPLCGCRMKKKSCYRLPFYTMHEYDRQTDRQTHHETVTCVAIGLGPCQTKLRNFVACLTWALSAMSP